MKQMYTQETGRQQSFHARHLQSNKSAVSLAFVDNCKSRANQVHMLAVIENATRVIAQRRFIARIHSSPRMNAQQQHMAAIFHVPV